MDVRAVNSDLLRLVGFLNLTDSKLDEFDRNSPRQPFDGSPDGFVLMTLRYITGTEDTSATLKTLRADLKERLLALLNPETPADKALKELLDRIDEMDLRGYRTLRDKKERDDRTSQNVDIVRVSPANATQKGKQRPVVETVAIVEGRYNDSASQYLYRVVDDALRGNKISQIRNCLHCKKFYIDSRKLTYCSTPCETAFNNERKRQKRLLQKEEIKKTKKRQGRKKNETAGLELFKKFQQLRSRKAKLTTQEMEFVARVSNRLSRKARDINTDWSKITLDAKKEYVRAAQIL